MNREVIRIEQEGEKPVELGSVEFTHFLTINDGWDKTEIKPHEYDKIVYLGHCSLDGDMFSAYHENGNILIFKGHLNSGKY